MSRFAAIKSGRETPTPSPSGESSTSVGQAATRAGKKAVSGYFSREMSRALHMLALERETSLQALMGEAFDDLLRKYGKHPFGER